MDYKTIMAEFDAGFKSKEDVNSVSAKMKHFLGVRKRGNKWQASIRHPKLKILVYLGCYSTPEEAALVVEKKKAEFEEMLNVDEGSRKKRCGNEFQVRKLPSGVSMERGKFRVRLWQPDLKKFASFGYYSTCEEAAVVADSKRVKDGLREKRRVREFQGRQLPCGVTREHGLFRVRLWDPLLKKFASFGYYSTCDEAAVVADRKRAELREVCVGKVSGSGECEDDDHVLLECTDEQISDVSDKLDCEFVHGSCTSNIEPGTSNSACVSDKRGVDQMSQRKTTCSLDEKLSSKKAALDTRACYHSPTSVLDTENSSHSPADEPNDTMVDVPFDSNIEPGYVSNFDEAVRLVTVNEYGQLLGEFSVLDEPIWFEM